MRYEYKTKGTCSKKIEFDFEDGRVGNIKFSDGCDGNLKALAILADGLTAEEIVQKCGGILCGRKNTSCADQLARAVAEAAGSVNKVES
ncbi:MAG: TIGR03905 family TSCPD domain-containing protein [Clostridiales bacterium]|jgi:uncharacterized protein (TIGR03905 family)|nr:TIGR03905 family TSCPD domain-containing protein [Clostridiales bacterium]